MPSSKPSSSSMHSGQDLESKTGSHSPRYKLVPVKRKGDVGRGNRNVKASVHGEHGNYATAGKGNSEPIDRDPAIRAEEEDDDGYDPYSDRRPDIEPLFSEHPWD
ncbi:MAG: hypothetical protein ACOYIK_08445 [Coriobacteriales bacterium]